MPSLLVALQFALIAAVAWLAAPAFLTGGAPKAAWVLVAAGLALGIWALMANRPGNFNIRPTPRAGGHLVREGPYRWIRHPMYTCIGLCAVGGALAADSTAVWWSALALAAVLVTKAALEERWMAEQHAGYAAYRASTRRFIPWLY